MGSYLIAAGSLPWLLRPENWPVVATVAGGLGFVIFVHELGHFLVAKACGVKCEKFYLGFDIYGLKLFKYQWGETEYGIGILPLGGYVKMLGQDDNPAAQAEEYERSRQGAAANASAATASTAATAATTGAHHEPPHGDLPAEPVAEDRSQHDPRSYLAQTVPERMAIISAGVVMNVIFAFFMAAYAYKALGVKEIPCVVGYTAPGGAAWEADLRPGTKVLKLGSMENPSYEDLLQGVPLSNLQAGIEMNVQRRGEEQPNTVTLVPNRTEAGPKVGIGPPRTLELHTSAPARKGSPAASAKPALASGDKIVKVDGLPVADAAALDATLAYAADKPVVLTVERKKDKAAKAEKAEAEKDAIETIDVTIQPQAWRDFGLVMKAGPISAIQAHSPAAARGLQAGDELLAVDGAALGDPMTLPLRLRRRAGETIRLKIARKEAGKPVESEIEITLRKVDWAEQPFPNGPISIPELGIAYKVLNRVTAVVPGSPAAEQGIKPGDEIVSALALPVKAKAAGDKASGDAKASSDHKDGDDEDDAPASKLAKPVLFTEQANWPYFIYDVQSLNPAVSLRFEVKTGERVREVEMSPSVVPELFCADRGLYLMTPIEMVHAASWSEAADLGARKTKKYLLLVYRILQKLGERQLSPTSLGGPISIATQAGYAAMDGTASFLMFLTMLSANLAVINFLPIPVLDGGHMVFLILEGIRRKPVSERIVVSFHYAGLAMILTLMVWVFGLDLYRLFGG